MVGRYSYHCSWVVYFRVHSPHTFLPHTEFSHTRDMIWIFKHLIEIKESKLINIFTLYSRFVEKEYNVLNLVNLGIWQGELWLVSNEYGTWWEMGEIEAIENSKRNFIRNNYCFCEKVPSTTFCMKQLTMKKELQ